jgi:hypothetical protein
MVLKATVDKEEAYLFECGRDDRLFAISTDPGGSNLPTHTCPGQWRFKAALQLGVHEAMPRAIDPEPILRGLRNVGYYVWREGAVRNPTGTSQ